MGRYRARAPGPRVYDSWGTSAQPFNRTPAPARHNNIKDTVLSRPTVPGHRPARERCTTCAPPGPAHRHRSTAMLHRPQGTDPDVRAEQ